MKSKTIALKMIEGGELTREEVGYLLKFAEKFDNI